MRKKIIAREVLVFFGCIIFMGILLLFAWAKESYYEHKVAGVQEGIDQLNNRLLELPTEYDWWLYNEVTSKFKESSKVSLADFDIPVDKNKKKYKVVTDPKILAQLNAGEPTANNVDWNMVLDETTLVSFSEFQKNLKSAVYIHAVANFLNIGIGPKEVENGFGYTRESSNKSNAIKDSISALTLRMSNYSANRYDSYKFNFYIAKCIIFILFVAYVLRFSIMSILWALRTVKGDKSVSNNQTQSL